MPSKKVRDKLMAQGKCLNCWKETDGPYCRCSACRAKEADHRQGHKNKPRRVAINLWHGLKRRCKKWDDPNQNWARYENVEVKMTRGEFLDWAIPEIIKFAAKYPNEQPTVHRLKKHYEINEIELLPKGLHAKRHFAQWALKTKEEQLEMIVKLCDLSELTVEEVVRALQESR
jgi:hypothetical protein